MIIAMFWLMETPITVTQALSLMFALAIGHVLADYPLQGEYLSTYKNRHHHSKAEGQENVPGMWFHCMLAHCLIHAGMVWVITGQVILGVTELVLHFTLDMLKCERRLSYHADQALHYACKMAYVLILVQGWLA